MSNANQAGAGRQSQQESVDALEMHLHFLGLTAELHTDPKPAVCTELFLGSRGGRVEQRERTSLPDYCGCAAVGKSPQGERGEGRGPGNQQEGEGWWYMGRMCPVHQSPQAAPG